MIISPDLVEITWGRPDTLLDRGVWILDAKVDHVNESLDMSR